VHKAVAFVGAVLVGGYLAGVDVAEGREVTVERLGVHGGGDVLHEQVVLGSSSSGGVSVRPHESDVLAIDLLEVQGVQGGVGILNGSEVHVSVAKGSACVSVGANVDCGHAANRREFVVKSGFVDRFVEITDIKGVRLIYRSSGSHDVL
jgi:hypothetical protein